MANRPRKGARDVSARIQVAAPHGGPGRATVGPKLNSMQLAELLRPFWSDLLQNNLKNVKKFVRENRARIDFNTARYTPCADGTGLHLCAQHGFTVCARLLLDIGVKLNLQNKVGSTALHVACKFNQEEMVLFLLQFGARMDVPDMRNNVAFDVAPYTLIDKCLLIPQRVKLAVEQREEARLVEIHDAAMGHFEQVTRAKTHALMLLMDWESRAWEQWQALQVTNKVDRDWNERVQRSTDLLEVKQAMYTDLQVQLEKEHNQMTEMLRTVFNEARNRQQHAREEMERRFMLNEETHQHWMREQQELEDQCGLLETAHEFPNDADVQHWVLYTMITMIDEGNTGYMPVNDMTTNIDMLFVREEIISVIRNVLLRFPTRRDLQLSALECIVRLVRHCNTVPIGTRALSFLTALLQANVMTLSRDVFSHFNQDVELAHLVIDVLYHLLHFRGADGAHSLQFCQVRASHELPLQIFRLHETIDLSQHDAESPLSTEAMLTAQHHASFLLFTLTKYNVKKTLEKDGAVSVICRLILELTKSFSDDEEAKASTLRYLVGSLALMHNSNHQNAYKTSSGSDLPTPWTVYDLSQLITAVRPWLVKCCLDSSDNGSLTKTHYSLAVWMIKLLRNLTQSLEDQVVELRTWLRTRETFDFLASLTLGIRKHSSQERDETGVHNVVGVWLELLEDIWLCRYNSDGQLAATFSYVMESLVQLLELEAHLTSMDGDNTAFINIVAVLKRIALVISNGKNRRFLINREYKIDVAVHIIVTALVNNKESRGSESMSETCSMELFAHVLRVYLRFFDDERAPSQSTVHLHERCRALGICAALRAFGLSDSDIRPIRIEEDARCTSPSLKANQTDENSTTNSTLRTRTKMQLVRAWSRSIVHDQSSHTPERETLGELARALLCHAPCYCYRVAI